MLIDTLVGNPRCDSVVGVGRRPYPNSPFTCDTFRSDVNI